MLFRSLFLAVVIDLFSRQVVGWSLREDMTRDIVIDALRMAWFKRQPTTWRLNRSITTARNSQPSPVWM